MHRKPDDAREVAGDLIDQHALDQHLAQLRREHPGVLVPQELPWPVLKDIYRQCVVCRCLARHWNNEEYVRCNAGMFHRIEAFQEEDGVLWLQCECAEPRLKKKAPFQKIL